MEANSQPTNIYFVNYKSALYRIDPRNIIFIKAAGKSCEFHLAEEVISVSTNMLGVDNLLHDEDYLVRVNRSYIVNIRHIARLLGNILFMSNKERIDLTPNAMKIIMEKVIVIK